MRDRWPASICPGRTARSRCSRVEGDDISVGIVNPDGSRAEMSGNGTRIAAAWLMSRTGSSRGPRARRAEDRGGATDWGRPLRVGVRRGRGGGAGARRRDRADPVVGRQSPRRSPGRPEPDRGARPTTREASAVPGADERAGRPGRAAWRGDGARLGARRGGDGGVRDERGRRRRSDPRDGEVVVHFPAATCGCVWRDGRAWLTGPAEPLDELPGSGHEAGTNGNRFARYRRLRGRRESYPTLWAGVVDLLRRNRSRCAALRCRSRTRVARRSGSS